MNETHDQSLKVCFLPDSSLVYGKRRDSRQGSARGESLSSWPGLSGQSTTLV
jgi:hypothetical protein